MPCSHGLGILIALFVMPEIASEFRESSLLATAKKIQPHFTVIVEFSELFPVKPVKICRNRGNGNKAFYSHWSPENMNKIPQEITTGVFT